MEVSTPNQSNTFNKHEWSSTGLLIFFDMYNADGAASDTFFDDLRKNHPGNAELLSAICEIPVDALDDKAIQRSTFLRVGIVLAGANKTHRQLTSVETQTIIDSLCHISQEEIAFPMNPALSGALGTLIHNQWRIIHYPNQANLTRQQVQPAWEKWIENHGSVLTNTYTVRMLHTLMRDIVFNKNAAKTKG